ncbi:hypothetical protein ACLH1N_07405 [Klebsiella sp. 1RUBe7cef]|uniref:Uncharacterized protein n=1 Tax=Klebsiella pneumoniae TaxID=573 RepID=A0A423A1K5_KLEPN|nr:MULTISPECIES: hypothetical protein [Enterobacteriaceae]EAR9993677.1 conjugal transfer protein TraG [Salmonella enterica]HEC1359345.1 hypothetical protein [Klebsiella aerogenes]HEC7141248.1 hypothetical protein [Salmonella enterica subsp. enterica serovar Javiana]EDT5075040.1 conjugal transfer protein TraG [Salmonella enterica subsp. enterica serovar Nottingham]EHV5566156.1 hypothetical protein [Salmonella enterica]
MSQSKSTKTNELKENKFENLKKLDSLFVLFIIVGAWIFGQIILKDPRLILFFEKIGNIPDLLSLFPIFSSSLLIATWFLYRGKSVKSLNDIILFFSVSYALYLFLFDNQEYEKLNNIKEVVSNLPLFLAKIAILNCSVAKTIITLFEFIIEWAKENSEKKITLQEKQNAEDNKASSSFDKDGKVENFEFNYKYEKTQGNKIEHEEISIMKFESNLQKDSNSSVKKPSKDDQNSINQIKTNPIKDKLITSLIILSLIILAFPFLYNIFIHFHR